MFNIKSSTWKYITFEKSSEEMYRDYDKNFIELVIENEHSIYLRYKMIHDITFNSPKIHIKFKIKLMPPYEYIVTEENYLDFLDRYKEKQNGTA